MGALAYVVRVYALVELGAETPGENPPLQKCTRWQVSSISNRKEKALGRLELLYC